MTIPVLQIHALRVLSQGPMTAREVTEELPQYGRTQITNALWQAKKQGRAVLDKTKYRITEKGRELIANPSSIDLPPPQPGIHDRLRVFLSPGDTA